MTPRTDNELLCQFIEKRCEASFSELVNRHISLVYSVALRMVADPHLAEDVAQATFSIFAREARHLRGRSHLGSWLHRTASNQAAKLVRAEVRRRAREQEACAMQSPPSDSDFDWKQIAPMLDGALNALGETDKAVILFRYFEKKTAAEIGAVLNISADAAQKRAHRALERLRGFLKGRGATLPTATLATLVSSNAMSAVPAGLPISISATVFAGSATATGLALTSCNIILMSKLKVTAVTALVLAGVATPILMQQHHGSRLRHENESLRAQVQNTREWLAEKEALVTQLEDMRRADELSQAERSELLRLRGEVGPLRRDSQELARFRALQPPGGTPARAADVPPPDFIPALAWANVGTDKPELAIQTFLWAGKHAESELVAQLLRWQRDRDIPPSDELDQNFVQGLIAGTTRLAGSLQGFRIQTLEIRGEDDMRVGIEVTDSAGQTKPHRLRLVRENNQWFPVMHVWREDQGSVRASLEVPSRFDPAR